MASSTGDQKWKECDAKYHKKTFGSKGKAYTQAIQTTPVSSEKNISDSVTADESNKSESLH